MSAATQLRLLRLNAGEIRDEDLFRLEKGWRVHFVLGPSLAGTRVRVFTNHPERVADGPERHRYRELAWNNYSDSEADVYDNYAEVYITMAGSFNYFFTTDNSVELAAASGRGYLLVDPVLRVGHNDERLPLDAVALQSVLAKCLGPLAEWPGRLRVAAESGYNFVHLTPLQSLGASGSAYCLRDQLALNEAFSRPGEEKTFADVAALIHTMKEEWGVLALTDLVLNHTANESPWLLAHPECAYNLLNSPHLRPAYLLDRIIWHFSVDISIGKYAARALPAEIRTEQHLKVLRELLTTIIPEHNMHEFYQMNINAVVAQVVVAVKDGHTKHGLADLRLQIVYDPQFRRVMASVNIDLAIQLFMSNGWTSQNETNLRRELEQLNRAQRDMVDSHMKAAIDNVVANARWRFVDSHGPRVKAVKVTEPIMWNFFVLPKTPSPVSEEEKEMYTEDRAQSIMAHNGWVMNDDPLKNFAEPGSFVYLRRELIPWGDSVKLRYGDRPADCPFLWQHMAQYAADTAAIFHGIRLDNCHSTPIHVAEYILDEARKVRPDIYIVAELFTNSAEKDNVFINRLGLTSLIREASHAGDSHEIGRLVNRFGGDPVGSFLKPPARILMPSMAHALFMDQTHDNPSPLEKKSALDSLSTSALVAISCCATGSNRGYDEFVPEHINVVTDDRLYPTWTDEDVIRPETVSSTTGLIAAKRALNKLHIELAQTGFTQLYVEQVTKDVVAVTRHNPVSHQNVVMVTRSAYAGPQKPYDNLSMTFPGVLDEVLLEAWTELGPSDRYKRHPQYITGVMGHVVRLRQNLAMSASHLLRLSGSTTSAGNEVIFTDLTPGCVVVFRLILDVPTRSAVLRLRQCLGQFGYRMPTYSGRHLTDISCTELEQIVSDLDLNAIGRTLFRCATEEREDGHGNDTYDVPGHGPLPYCGLQGVVSLLNKIRPVNDLGHPLCNNLREGDWLPDYIANRLMCHRDTAKLGRWFGVVFKELRHVPRYLVPAYFDAMITGVYSLLEEVAWAKMSDFVKTGSSFVRCLAMGSLQFCSVVSSASLPRLSPRLRHDDLTTEQVADGFATLSAGLPHFAAGLFRVWGRDTFIAMRGCLLLPGRHGDARRLLLAFAAALRHGLIPNLLGGGTHARYNCRDATWWWLECVQQYVQMVPGGSTLLADPVCRLYPEDNSSPQETCKHEQPLRAVIQEALQRHASGIKFRERNAGVPIDSEMQSEGFFVEAGVDWKTGFIYGGNKYNCGTWMDKMGSSVKTGNKGWPATPRDGSAVEIVGLCQSALRWLQKMFTEKKYPTNKVTRTVNGKESKITFADWSKLIQANFEKHFWVPATATPGENQQKLVNRRAIYKDTVGASNEYPDFQLRPNFTIAMVVAPELFEASHAWLALSMVEKYLQGPLGLKTLDSSDWNYNGIYNNNDASKGFNYHQGPEWVWPMGFYLRAKLHFASAQGDPALVQQTVIWTEKVMSEHNMHIHKSAWKSLPELTNAKGQVCAHSCPAQAWSMGCILEVVHDLDRLHPGGGPRP